LTRSEERLRLALTAAEIGIWEWDPQTHQITWSEGAERLFGRTPDAFSQTHAAFFNLIHPQDQPKVAGALEKAVADGSRFKVEYRIVWPDDTIRWMSSRGKVVAGSQGNSSRLAGTIHDITERKSLEAQLRQAQKMEVVGQLAGGIAHDFNNLLTVINGYSALILDRLEPEDSLYLDLMQVQKAGERAAKLTAQLLAFSRNQVLQPELLNLNEVVANIEKMLRRLIGENINLETALQADLGQVKADPSQLEQVILNLAVNARDAMPEGGELAIKTANVELDEFYTRRHAGVKPGPYVLLAVSDTGAGMDAETQGHIFEPFFTTKEPGKGTGLGLATVYGIIKQSDGHIWFYSEPGHGTTFKIYLPRSGETTEPVQSDMGPLLCAGTETILLVEDETEVRVLTGKVLLEYGYKILEAIDANQALHLCEQHDGAIDLLITDVIMPGGMNGRQLAGRLIGQYPELRVLYVSGYTDDIIAKQGILDAGAGFLEKPFNPDILARKVRELLDTVKG
jgi:PAS domain S-box-containing protein